MRHLVCILLATYLGWQPLQAQQTRKTVISFEPVYAGAPLRLDSTYANGLRFHTFRFYISGVQLFDRKKGIFTEKESYHLLDAADPATMQLALDVKRAVPYIGIHFNLGIDSTTNVSGALGGDLDPSRGMYWSWQSGYVNFKLEGSSPACKERNSEFQFHLGGYSAPFASAQKVMLDVNNLERITILVDITKFISAIDLASQNSIMIPCADAVTLSRLAATMFSIKQ